MSDNITLVLKSHNQEIALREVVRICLGTTISVSETAPDKNFVISKADFSGDFISVETEINYNGKSGKNTYEHKIDCEKTENQNMTNAVKTGFYKLFCELFEKTLPWGSQTGIRPALLAQRRLNAGETPGDCIKSLMKEYSISEEKASLATEVALNEAKILEKHPKKGVSIYIGIPFCPTRCLYCSFVSLPLSKQKNTVEPYVKALCREVEYTGKILRERGVPVDSIYIGGGTPTSLNCEQLNSLLESVKNSFDLPSLYEFTIEAGRADTISCEKLQTIYSLNTPNLRISINPQTLNDSVLKVIGRNHTAGEFMQAYNMAREIGFKNINCDVIAGLPSETPKMFLNSLSSLCDLAPENITVHTMCIKRAASLKNAEFSPTSPEDVTKMVSDGSKILRNHGYLPYYMYRQKDTLGGLENTGFSKAGYEGLYNILMMEDASTVIGLGAGAVSKIIDFSTGRIDRVYNFKDPWEYAKNFDEILKRKSFLHTL